MNMLTLKIISNYYRNPHAIFETERMILKCLNKRIKPINYIQALNAFKMLPYYI